MAVPPSAVAVAVAVNVAVNDHVNVNVNGAGRRPSSSHDFRVDYSRGA
jgi:hypothetical protein